MFEHPEFGLMCVCECHRKGNKQVDCLRCCSFAGRKYLNADGSVDEPYLREMMEEHGIKPVFEKDL